MSDLFGDDPPPPARRPRPSDRLRAQGRDQTYPDTFGRPPVRKDPLPAPALESPAAPVACVRPAYPNGKTCARGGGDACFSVDNGKTWLCRNHVPADFFAGARKRP